MLHEGSLTTKNVSFNTGDIFFVMIFCKFSLFITFSKLKKKIFLLYEKWT